MDWNWAVGTAISMLAIFVTVLATRKYGNRRKQIATLLIATPLLADGPTPDEVEVTVQGVKMKNPHSVRIALSNIGPRDIIPGDFPRDSVGRIKIEGCTQMGPLQGDLRAKDGTLLGEAGGVGGGGTADPTVWEFSAVHVPAKSTITLTGIVDGQPTSMKLDPFIDVDVMTLDDSAKTSTAHYRLLIGGATLFLLPIAISLIGTLFGVTQWPNWTDLLFLLMPIGIGISLWGAYLDGQAPRWRARITGSLFPELVPPTSAKKGSKK